MIWNLRKSTHWFQVWLSVCVDFDSSFATFFFLLCVCVLVSFLLKLPLILSVVLQNHLLWHARHITHSHPQFHIILLVNSNMPTHSTAVISDPCIWIARYEEQIPNAPAAVIVFHSAKVVKIPSNKQDYLILYMLSPWQFLIHPFNNSNQEFTLFLIALKSDGWMNNITYRINPIIFDDSDGIKHLSFVADQIIFSCCVCVFLNLGDSKIDWG